LIPLRSASGFCTPSPELVDLEDGSIYLNQANGHEFKLVSHLGKEPKQRSLLVGTPLVDTLQELPLVRVRQAGSLSPEPAQRQLKELMVNWPCLCDTKQP